MPIPGSIVTWAIQRVAKGRPLPIRIAWCDEAGAIDGVFTRRDRIGEITWQTATAITAYPQHRSVRQVTVLETMPYFALNVRLDARTAGTDVEEDDITVADMLEAQALLQQLMQRVAWELKRLSQKQQPCVLSCSKLFYLWDSVLECRTLSAVAAARLSTRPAWLPRQSVWRLPPGGAIAAGQGSSHPERSREGLEGEPRGAGNPQAQQGDGAETASEAVALQPYTHKTREQLLCIIQDLRSALAAAEVCVPSLSEGAAERPAADGPPRAAASAADDCEQEEPAAKPRTAERPLDAALLDESALASAACASAFDPFRPSTWVAMRDPWQPDDKTKLYAALVQSVVCKFPRPGTRAFEQLRTARRRLRASLRVYAPNKVSHASGALTALGETLRERVVEVMLSAEFYAEEEGEKEDDDGESSSGNFLLLLPTSSAVSPHAPAESSRPLWMSSEGSRASEYNWRSRYVTAETP